MVHHTPQVGTVEGDQEERYGLRYRLYVTFRICPVLRPVLGLHVQGREGQEKREEDWGQGRTGGEWVVVGLPLRVGPVYRFKVVLRLQLLLRVPTLVPLVPLDSSVSVPSRPGPTSFLDGRVPSERALRYLGNKECPLTPLYTSEWYVFPHALPTHQEGSGHSEQVRPYHHPLPLRRRTRLTLTHNRSPPWTLFRRAMTTTTRGSCSSDSSLYCDHSSSSSYIGVTPSTSQLKGFCSCVGYHYRLRLYCGSRVQW